MNSSQVEFHSKPLMLKKNQRARSSYGQRPALLKTQPDTIQVTYHSINQNDYVSHTV